MADEGQVDLPATKHRELKTGNVHSPGQSSGNGVRACSVISVESDALQPHGLCSPPGYSVHGIPQARKLE